MVNIAKNKNCEFVSILNVKNPFQKKVFSFRFSSCLIKQLVSMSEKIIKTVIELLSVKRTTNLWVRSIFTMFVAHEKKK